MITWIMIIVMIIKIIIIIIADGAKNYRLLENCKIDDIILL